MKNNAFKIAILLAVFITSNLFMLTGFAQRVLTGTVYKDGKPAAGATVSAHKTSNTFFTSFDGTYKLEVHEKSKWVKVELGGEDQKIKLTSDKQDVFFGEKPSDDPDDEADAGDGVECLSINELKTNAEFTKLHTYTDPYGLGKYDEAYDRWSIILKKFPCATRNIYSHGANILAHKIDKAGDEKTKEAYIDTLMILYDKRMKYFGKSKKYPVGYIMGRKGIDHYRFRPEKPMAAIKILEKAMDKRGAETEDAVVISYMLATVKAFKNNEVKSSVVVNNYIKAAEILENKLKTLTDAKDKEATTASLNSVETSFAKSGAATCDDLFPIFTPKFEKAPKDLDLLKKITKILDRTDCTDSDLFSNAAENLYAIEPSAQAAYSLAITFLRKKELGKSSEYFQKAIEMEENDSLKAKYYHKLGLVELARNNPQKAYQHGVKAKNLSPKWGQPYILMGLAYAAGKDACGSTPFEHSAVYWFAVDKFAKAKAVDPEVADEAKSKINQYSKYFPGKEEIFMQGYTNKVYSTMNNSNCWIKEKSKARPSD